MRAIRHCRRPAAGCRRPGAPAGTAQASGPAPAIQGEPHARASIAIQSGVSATDFRNHLLPALAALAMSTFGPHGRAGAHDQPRYRLRTGSRCQAAPRVPPGLLGYRRALVRLSRAQILRRASPPSCRVAGVASLYSYALLWISGAIAAAASFSLISSIAYAGYGRLRAGTPVLTVARRCSWSERCRTGTGTGRERVRESSSRSPAAR